MPLRRSKTTAGLTLLAALALSVAHADEWDVGGDADNAFTTDNVVAHGSEQIHDLAVLQGPAPDQDWFLAPTQPFSSYQFVVDGTTGELDLTPASVQRMTTDGAGVLQNALVTDFGGAVTLNWISSASSTPGAVLDLVRVQGAACGTGCTGVDRYRARFYDTTYTIPRFNNSGTQATALTVQNATNRACDVAFFYFDGAGALLLATPGTLGPRGLLVVPTASLVPNQSGSVRIAHTCGYGGLSGKAVSVEPATGLAFDTAMLHRPH